MRFLGVAVSLALLWFLASYRRSVEAPSDRDALLSQISQYIAIRNPSLSDAQRNEVASAILEAANVSGVSTSVLVAMADVESTFRPWVEHPTTGARGLLQVRKIAFDQVRQVYPDQVPASWWPELFTARKGAIVGALYLRWILSRGYDLRDSLARYGGGEISPSYAYADQVLRREQHYLVTITAGR